MASMVAADMKEDSVEGSMGAPLSTARLASRVTGVVKEKVIAACGSFTYDIRLRLV
jgi:hypothetical protein